MNKGPLLIGLTGLAGSGKSSVAGILRRRYGGRVVPFASPLKKMLAALGVPKACLYGADKERPLDLLRGHTARHAMQTLGTEWGRGLIGDDFWLCAWADAVSAVPRDVLVVVADDVRFANEAECIRDNGGLVLRVVRPSGRSTAGGHASETGDFAADAMILNNGTKQQLGRTVAGIVDPILSRRTCRRSDKASTDRA